MTPVPEDVRELVRASMNSYGNAQSDGLGREWNLYGAMRFAEQAILADRESRAPQGQVGVKALDQARELLESLNEWFAQRAAREPTTNSEEIMFEQVHARLGLIDALTQTEAQPAGRGTKMSKIDVGSYNHGVADALAKAIEIAKASYPHGAAVTIKHKLDELAVALTHPDPARETFVPGDENDPHWLRTMAAGLASNGHHGDAERLTEAADEIVALRRAHTPQEVLAASPREAQPQQSGEAVPSFDVMAARAWDFAAPKLAALNKEKGLAGVWSNGLRSGWDAALKGGKE